MKPCFGKLVVPNVTADHQWTGQRVKVGIGFDRIWVGFDRWEWPGMRLGFCAIVDHLPTPFDDR